MESPAFPQPTQQQARLIWLAVSALSLALFLAVLGALFWGLGWVLQRLTPVLLPLAIAGILAYLLDPVVDRLEAWGMKRSAAILLVFFVGVGIVVGISLLVIPRLLAEMKDFAEQVPVYAKRLSFEIKEWIEKSAWTHKWTAKLKEAWAADLQKSLQKPYKTGQIQNHYTMLMACIIYLMISMHLRMLRSTSYRSIK